jgi:hypothetical protein
MEDKNVLFVTLDSCRYDLAEQADIPTIRSLGPLRKAYTHGSYTVPAHAAFFSGHLPVVLDEPKLLYYSDAVKQLWRIRTGPSRDTRGVGLLLEGSNVLDGYKNLGYHVLGVGGVTQFAEGSVLRSYFGNDFLFYGPNLDEELLESRKKESFPLNHVDEIVNQLSKHEQWFLFLNCPETHYPYDCGNGIPTDVERYFPLLKKSLNLRETEEELPEDFSQKLKAMQIEALESIDYKLEQLFDALPKERDILVVICGDHGENFGEYFSGRKRWGHLFPSPEVMEVPIVVGEIHG